MGQSDGLQLEDDGRDAPREREVARPVAAGLPPEEGPEVRVRLARPSLMRGRPFTTFGLVLLPFAVAILGKVLLKQDFPWWPHTMIAFGALAAICWFVLFTIWLRFSVSRSLEVTNKRIIERNGLFSRSTDEVLHQHIRNITVKQSFFERLMGIGEIGISSSGQSTVEIDIRDIPDPDAIREIIDQYRPL